MEKALILDLPLEVPCGKDSRPLFRSDPIHSVCSLLLVVPVSMSKVEMMQVDEVSDA